MKLNMGAIQGLGRRLFAAGQQGQAKAQDMKQVASSAEIFEPHAIDMLVDALMQMPDPDTVLEAAGLTRADMRRLEGDDEISGALDTRLAAVHSTPWRLEPGDGADFDWLYPQIEAFFESMIATFWAAVPYGYSVGEMVYAKDKGRIVWAHWEERPFEWFAPMPDGRLLYYPEHGGLMGVDVFTKWPGQFFLTRRRPTYRQPYGQAVMTRVYWPWFMRNQGWKFWARFLERFGSPLLLGKTANSTSEMAAALARALQSAVAAIGADDDVDAISPSNAGDSFQRFADTVDRRIQKVILGQTLTTDVGSGGSYAAAKVHNAVRDDRRMADVRLVTASMQRAVDILMMLNGKPAGTVRFVMEDPTGLQSERAERDSKLAQAGIVKLTEEYLLRSYDFEAGDFEIPSAESTPPASQATGAKASALFASHANRFTPEQTALERLADSALAQAGQPIPREAIKTAIAAATDPEDLADRLSLLYSGTDSREFAELLEQALFAADLMGYGHMTGQDDQDNEPQGGMGALLASTEPAPAPNITVNVAPPTVEINMAEGMVKADFQATNILPDQQPPSVTVQVPEAPAPVVQVQASAPTVNVEVAPAEIQEVRIASMPTRKTKTHINRDDFGNIQDSEQVETDD